MRGYPDYVAMELLAGETLAKRLTRDDPIPLQHGIEIMRQLMGAVARIHESGDVYALGVVFYELLTMVKPFLGDLPVDVIRQILEKDPLPPSRFRPEIGSALDERILAMISRQPEARPEEGVLLERISLLAA